MFAEYQNNGTYLQSLGKAVWLLSVCKFQPSSFKWVFEANTLLHWNIESQWVMSNSVLVPLWCSHQTIQYHAKRVPLTNLTTFRITLLQKKTLTYHSKTVLVSVIRSNDIRNMSENTPRTVEKFWNFHNNRSRNYSSPLLDPRYLIFVISSEDCCEEKDSKAFPGADDWNGKSEQIRFFGQVRQSVKINDDYINLVREQKIHFDQNRFAHAHSTHQHGPNGRSFWNTYWWVAFLPDEFGITCLRTLITFSDLSIIEN